MIISTKILLLYIIAFLCFISAPPASADTPITGAISGTLTLANSPYVVTTNDITVNSGVKLTIEPGVVLKFDGGKSLVVFGELDARGTADAPITFTSSAATPGVGSWGAININNNGIATMDYCMVKYGGQFGYLYGQIKKTGAGALNISNTTIDTFRGDAVTLTDATGTVTISSSTIDGLSLYNSTNGIVISGATSGGNITISGNIIKNISAGYNCMILQSSAAPHINGNTFINSSGYGILVNTGAAPVLDTTNTFTATGSGLVMGFDAISSGVAHTYDSALTAPVVVTGGAIASPASISWSSIRPYIIAGNITVNYGSKLTIQPGVVLKFNGGIGMYIDGELDARGTANALITFTSTNTVNPGAGSWGNININNNGTITLDYCLVKYGGSGPSYTYGSIIKSGAGNVTMTNTNIETFLYYGIILNNTPGTINIGSSTIDGASGSNSRGILISGASSANNISVSNSTIKNNTTYGLQADTGATPKISGNTFINSSGYGILVNTGAAPVLDTANTFTATGSGLEMGFDAISSGVAHTYDNALTAPVAITGGIITSPASISWNSNRTYYVVGNITVNSGASLTIQPGTVVKLNPVIIVTVAGSFTAGSNSGSKTYLTSYRDATVGSAIKGTSGLPTAGDWAYIFANTAGASITIDNCEIRYGGKNPYTYTYGVILKSGSGAVSITNSTFSSYVYYAVALDSTTDSVTLTGNTIQASGSDGRYCISLNNASGNTSIASNIINSSNSLYDCLIVSNSSPLIKDNIITGGLTGIKLTSTVASSPTIRGNTITGAAKGVSVSGATSTPQIIKNTITGNGVGVYVDTSANPVIGGASGNGNNLYNTTWSVQNATSSTPPLINAQYNFWGSAAGPYHATTNTGGNQSSKVTDNVYYANWTSPPSGSISINNGATYTTQSDVTVNFACSDSTGCENITISNDNNTFLLFDFIASSGWIINTEGSNTIYVRFRYGSGVWSPVYQASIILDSTRPERPVVTGSTPNQSTHILWNWTSGGGGNGKYHYQMRGDNGWTETTDTSFAPSSALQAGDYALAVQERDEAGNWSLTGTGSITLKADNWLTTTVSGYGTIQGTSTMGQEYSSNPGPNTASFVLNDQISLAATPSTDFTFAGWTGDCTAANGPCTLYMVADRTIAAAFTTTKAALLFSPDMTTHDTLAAAYAASPLDSSVTILGRNQTYGATLLLDKNVTVTLRGGYDASFATVAGLSTVNGKVTVIGGRLNAIGLAIR